MSFLQLISFRLLRGPNLVANVPGAVGRLQIDDAQIADHRLYFQKFDQIVKDHILEGTSAKFYEIPSDSMPFNAQLSSRVASLALELQHRLDSNVSVFKCSERRDVQQVDFFVSYEFITVVQRTLQLILKFARRLQMPDEDSEAFFASGFKTLRDANVTLSPRQETRMIIRAVEARGIPWRFLLDSNAFMKIGYGKRQKIFQSKTLDIEGHVTFKLTDDKAITSTILNTAGLPGTRFKTVVSLEEAQAFASDVGYPVVTKPLVGMQGYGVTPNIQNAEELVDAYKIAARQHPKVMVEKHVQGDDHRMLVIDGKYQGCAKRSVTRLKGDGQRSVQQLVDEVNKEPFRNRVPSSPKYQITHQDIITQTLAKQGYDWDSIPAEGAEVAMHIVPNISQGGTLVDITDVHPANIEMAERAARLFGLKIGGIDYLTDDITVPYWESGGVMCEVNAGPALDIMKGGEDAHMELLGRIAFEVSCPPDKNMELPVVVIMGSDEALGDALKQNLQGQGLRVAQKRFDGAHIGLAPPVFGDDPQKAVEAALMDASLDASIIQESGHRLRQYGLGFDVFSHLVITEVPTLEGREYPEMLTLLLNAVSHHAYYVAGDPAIETWIDQLPKTLKAKLIETSAREMMGTLTAEVTRLSAKT